MSRARFCLLFCTALLASSAAGGAELVVIDDSIFDEADWVFTKFPTQPDECLFFHDSTGTTICGQQSASSDGDGFSHGGLSQISGEGVVTTELIVGAHVQSHLAYLPAVSGAVASVAASFELQQLAATQGVASTIRGHLIVEQGGSFFLSVQSEPVSSAASPSAFESFAASGLTTADFSLVSEAAIDASTHPDFSTAGAPLRFGYAIDLQWDAELPNNIFVTDFLVRSFRVDEFKVTVTIEDAPAIPLLPPLALTILALGLAAILLALIPQPAVREARGGGPDQRRQPEHP